MAAALRWPAGGGHRYQISKGRTEVAVIKGRDECTAELKLPTKDSLSEIPRNPVCSNSFCTKYLIEITSKPVLRRLC